MLILPIDIWSFTTSTSPYLPSFWSLVLCGSRSHTQIKPHLTLIDKPHSILSTGPCTTLPQFFISFGVKVNILKATDIKLKLSPLKFPIRYLYDVNVFINMVLCSEDNNTTKVRMSNFHPIHPALDPTAILASNFRMKALHQHHSL